MNRRYRVVRMRDTRYLPWLVRCEGQLVTAVQTHADAMLFIDLDSGRRWRGRA